MTLSSVGPLPLLVKPQAPPNENLRTGARAARLELAVDGNVLLSHVQIPEVVDLGDESAEAHGSACVRRPDDIALLMVPEDRSIANITTIRIGY
jgi:hypothetical protein